MYNRCAVKYEEVIIHSMFTRGMTLREALSLDLDNHVSDPNNVYDVVDFLEEKLENLDKVQYYMEVLTGLQPDVILRKTNDRARGSRS